MYLPIQIDQTKSPSDENDTSSPEEGSFDKKCHSCTYPGCGKTFRYKSEFIRHNITHAPERIFNCPFEDCAKKFKREDVLKGHMRIHTGETPYKCEESDCGQSFSNRASLRYHILRHKGEREYKCSFPGCNKSFLILSQLKQHESAPSCHLEISSTETSLNETDSCESSPVKLRKRENTSCAVSTVRDSNINTKLEPEPELKMKEISVDDEFERVVKALMYENRVMKMKLNMISIFRESVQKKKAIENMRNLLIHKLSNAKTSAILNFEVKSE